jgi:hypothetical protein
MLSDDRLKNYKLCNYADPHTIMAGAESQVRLLNLPRLRQPVVERHCCHLSINNTQTPESPHIEGKLWLDADKSKAAVELVLT